MPNLLISDVCKVDGIVWAYSLTEAGFLHQLSSDLNHIIKSIGNGVDPTDILERAQRRSARIYCDTSNRYVAYQFQNLIQIYNTRSEELTGEIRLPDIVPVETVLFSGANGTSIAYKYFQGKLPDKGVNFQDNLKNIYLIHQIAVIQYERTFKESDVPSQIITYFVEIDSGSYSFTDELDFIIAIYNNRMLLRDTYGYLKLVQYSGKQQ